MSQTSQRPFSAKATATRHFSALGELLADIDLDEIQRVCEVLRRARDSNATIFLAGNGGSAATVSHWVNDLGKATKRSGRAPMRVVSLVDNVSWLSALANDEGYERAFAGQLENFAQKGDVLIVVSASGNSPNLLAAVELAKRRGTTTIGLIGFDGGKLKQLVDEMIFIRTERGEYEVVEDAHGVVCHAITKSLAGDLAEAV